MFSRSVRIYTSSWLCSILFSKIMAFISSSTLPSLMVPKPSLCKTTHMSFNNLLVAPPSFTLTYSSQASFSRLVSFFFAGILAFMSHPTKSNKVGCSIDASALSQYSTPSFQ